MYPVFFWKLHFWSLSSVIRQMCGAVWLEGKIWLPLSLYLYAALVFNIRSGSPSPHGTKESGFFHQGKLEFLREPARLTPTNKHTRLPPGGRISRIWALSVFAQAPITRTWLRKNGAQTAAANSEPSSNPPVSGNYCLPRADLLLKLSLPFAAQRAAPAGRLSLGAESSVVTSDLPNLIFAARLTFPRSFDPKAYLNWTYLC